MLDTDPYRYQINTDPKHCFCTNSLPPPSFASVLDCFLYCIFSVQPLPPPSRLYSQKFKPFLLLSLPAGWTRVRVTRPRLWVRRWDPPPGLTTSLLFCPHSETTRAMYFYWRPPKIWWPSRRLWRDVPPRGRRDGRSRDGVMTGCPATESWRDVPRGRYDRMSRAREAPPLTNNGRISYPKVVEHLNLFLCVFLT